MKRLLHLQEHKHTARRLPHGHTSYRGLVVVLAVFGLCLFGIRQSVYADSYTVTARVAAPMPSQPAEITSPVSGITTASDNLVVSGTCPVMSPAIIVVVYRNDDAAGSVGCTADGTFSGTFALVQGANVFKPKLVTITNDSGPEGAAVIVHKLTVPQSVQQPVVSGATQSPSGKTTTSTSTDSANSPVTFTVKTNQQILVFKPGESFTWKIAIDGGQSPYTIMVDWGDGTHSVYAANSSGEQNLSHIFSKSKNTVVKIRVKDANGKEVYTTVAGVTFRAQSDSAVAGAVSTKALNPTALQQIWLLYAFVIGVVILLWLHSRHKQLIVLFRRRKTKPQRRRV